MYFGLYWQICIDLKWLKHLLRNEKSNKMLKRQDYWVQRCLVKSRFEEWGWGGGMGVWDKNERPFVVSQCPHYCLPLSIQRDRKKHFLFLCFLSLTYAHTQFILSPDVPRVNVLQKNRCFPKIPPLKPVKMSLWWQFDIWCMFKSETSIC